MQARYIWITVSLVVVIALMAGCTGAATNNMTNNSTDGPTATPTETPTMVPGHATGGKMTVASATATPTPLVYGTVTIDGKPVAKCFVNIVFPSHHGYTTDSAITDANGNYIIPDHGIILRERTFSNIMVYKNDTLLYEDTAVYQIDGQSFNIILTS